MYQSKPDVYVVMFIGTNGESGALAAFSTLDAAKAHLPNVCYDGPIWIERLRVDTPGFYHEEKDCIMWRSF